MATMFPADVTSFLTTGEEATYSFLQRTARPDGKFLCWYAPDIEEREPDFILLSPDCGLVVLDEVCDGVNAGLLPLAELLSLLDCAKAEVVLTGRDPAPELIARADYVTRFQKEKHPYDLGIPARTGVEF